MSDVTPPLDDFLREFKADGNLWWSTDCGHHLNLFEAAVERMQQAERALGEGVAADNLQQELDRLERPYERTLSDGDGDLG